MLRQIEWENIRTDEYMGKLLTILTPTYNRGEYLENIFVSLQQQTDKDSDKRFVHRKLRKHCESRQTNTQ